MAGGHNTPTALSYMKDHHLPIDSPNQSFATNPGTKMAGGTNSNDYQTSTKYKKEQPDALDQPKLQCNRVAHPNEKEDIIIII